MFKGCTLTWQNTYRTDGATCSPVRFWAMRAPDVMGRAKQPMSCAFRVPAVLVVVGLLAMAGCSRSPEAQKARHLERGDKYAAREQYREAILEYRNVLRLEPANARAMKQLGLFYNQLGEYAQALRFLLKAQELTPDDSEVRLKLGGVYLLGGK